MEALRKEIGLLRSENQIIRNQSLGSGDDQRQRLIHMVKKNQELEYDNIRLANNLEKYKQLKKTLFTYANIATDDPVELKKMILYLKQQKQSRQLQ